jgi:3-hydroxypropanoate dehydrogenase
MSLLDEIFYEARTHRTWQERPVDPELLKKIHDMAKFGPTSANCCPLRIIYVRTPEAKERLKPTLDEGNVKKTMSAPLTAIFAADLEFYAQFEKLNPKNGQRFQELYGSNPKLGEETARLNANLQAAYLMLAARACGLDCGPMSGFDAAKVAAAFFGDRPWRALFLCNLGYGVKEDVGERLPRFDFGEVAEVL